MLAAFALSQVNNRNRLKKLKQLEKEKKLKANKTDAKAPSDDQIEPPKKKGVKSRQEIDKFSLLKRYLNLLKVTLISFLLSTSLHVGCVSGYYYYFLWMNPDDPGKKKFYSTTTSTGVNIGGRIVGGGGIQTNHHKSYLLHLIREHYKGLSKMFFIQFSAIYLFILFMFNFFPERAKLQQDTMAAFKSVNDEPVRKTVKVVKPARPVSAASLLKKRTQIKNKEILEEIDEFSDDEQSTSKKDD